MTDMMTLQTLVAKSSLLSGARDDRFRRGRLMEPEVGVRTGGEWGEKSKDRLAQRDC